MKISYNWLKQFLQIGWEAEQTADLLTDLGLEVEGIESFESVKGGLKGIVVGHVLTCEKHSNADKLKVTTVDIGAGAPVQIVCGAPNVAAGQKVPVATIGTVLYTEEGEAWKIKKGKIRGEESHGMICAEDELGLGKGHDGIMVLSEDLEPGTEASTIFDIENDIVFEIGLTPNRADAMSHLGVARDLKAGLKQKEIQLELITPSLSNFNVANRSLKIDVDVVDNKLAPRYCGVTISNLTVEESPTWLKNRLKAIGLNPINNIVDATNYVLHELGQPLHAFDANKIKDHKVIVKTLPPGTKFRTLDDTEIELHEDDLMICDSEKPLCIAGVYGGLNSGVTDSTTAIFLESAYFDPISVRKTSKRHGFNTDASFRFERGIDINNVEFSLKRAAILIQQIAGGDITSDIMDFYPHKEDDYQVFLTFKKINKLIGQEIPKDTIKSILASLDIKLNNVTETGLGLTIPFYRVDVRREVDVIEELLRVYGYNNIAFKEKLNASVATTSPFEDYKVQAVVGDFLAAKGFNEIMTNSLSTPANNEVVERFKEEQTVKIINPLSNDLSIMRRSLLFSGLEAALYNINRKKQNLKLFEFGKSYHVYNEKQIEHKHLALFVTGNKNDDNWIASSEKVSFFTLKSSVESILQRLGISNFNTVASKSEEFAEGLTFKSKKIDLVDFGVVKSSILKKFDIKTEVLYADFKWDAILELIADNTIKYTEISKFPEVKRDFALLLDDKVSFKEIHDIAFETEKALLKEVSLFDVYTGDKLPAGKKSYAVSFTLKSEKATLTDKQIEKIMSKFQNKFETKLGAELR
ncbi:phenylalanine--tRNA ligase subunit beta [Cellulophaga baltica]|uniref:phenylalanine--tRNA ligase subunit beta n=1 Tax=Cellulophaga TaxID=104264 RepID=UPI001C06C889|nr:MULTISPECIES: phenylalanine--tRNA ligase subunit beta [Cellulophaga]MBU2996087.1 phenylalanine--tRNA ligase subunit beta [Cellulophaga baltica]MDO6767482.1 phenylalanine--tRNA ligase subunit beta [Cellulophaga sp. 1_MG-2023]